MTLLSAAAFILEEAFEGDEPRDELQSFGSPDPWDISTGAVLGRWQSVVGMLRWIQAHADELPEHGARPYWPERNGRVLSSAPLESEQLRARNLSVSRTLGIRLNPPTRLTVRRSSTELQ